MSLPSASVWHRAILADGARNDDEGDVQFLLLHDLEGAQRVESGHGEIGENDLGSRLQVVPVTLLGFYSIGDRIVAGAAQRGQHQLEVVGIVFKNQEAKRRGDGQLLSVRDAFGSPKNNRPDARLNSGTIGDPVC